MTNKKKTNNKKKHLFSEGILTGLAVGSAALLFFLYGTKEGQKERKKLKGWMLMMKGEVIHKLENLKEVNKGNYYKIVDEVSKKYGKAKGVSIKEISVLNRYLKSKWESIKKEAGKGQSQRGKSKAGKKI